MPLNFNLHNREKYFLDYVPTGKAWAQARASGTNFNRLCQWAARATDGHIEAMNRLVPDYHGLSRADTGLINQLKEQYGLPNDTFPTVDDGETLLDIYCMRFLMNDNRPPAFQRIANLYNVDMAWRNGSDPYSVSIRLDFEEDGGFPYTFPQTFTYPLIGKKIRAIYDRIKPLYLTINYSESNDGWTFPSRIPNPFQQ